MVEFLEHLGMLIGAIVLVFGVIWIGIVITAYFNSRR